MKKYKVYEELELKDDFIFGKVMRDPNLCRRTLQTLLDVEIESVHYPEQQKSIDIKVDGKAVRLDVYVEDDQGRIYDGEMQQFRDGNEETLPKRTRYYQGVIDLHLLEKGVEYQNLKESCVLFVCTFDPFGKGRCRYTFENTCKEDPDLILNDGTKKVFLNTKGKWTPDISTELKAFLDYVEYQEVTDDLTRDLEEAVEQAKVNLEFRREYMKAYLMVQEAKSEGRAEGREEGRAEGRAEGAARYLVDMVERLAANRELSVEEVCELLGESHETYMEAKKFLGE